MKRVTTAASGSAHWVALQRCAAWHGSEKQQCIEPADLCQRPVVKILSLTKNHARNAGFLIHAHIPEFSPRNKP